MENNKNFIPKNPDYNLPANDSLLGDAWLTKETLGDPILGVLVWQKESAQEAWVANPDIANLLQHRAEIAELNKGIQLRHGQLKVYASRPSDSD